MPKPLPLADFRSRRTVLVRSDFGYAPKPAPRPSDIIDEKTWDSIVTLPDDVAVRTSNYHGETIRQLHDLWGAWIEHVGEKHDCMFPVMLEAGDDFQAATYNALIGFYRLSVAALRSALELTAIDAWTDVGVPQCNAVFVAASGINNLPGRDGTVRVDPVSPPPTVGGRRVVDLLAVAVLVCW